MAGRKREQGEHMKTTIDMAREAGLSPVDYPTTEKLNRFEALVRADERMSFYGQDKPAECADGCPPNQICDYCQVVAPVKAMILAEREACAKVADGYIGCDPIADAIRARGQA
jgi:hypothetical protein